MIKDKLIVTAGDYDLLNVDEIKFLEKCKSKGDWLIVGLHSDMIILLKENMLYNTFDDRLKMLESLKCVDEVQKFDDSDGTYCRLLRNVKLFYPQADITFISKYDMENMPERKIRGINFEVL